MIQASEPWAVYIIICSDKRKSLYTGITNNVEIRIEKHNSGKGAKFTKGRRPVKLLAVWFFDNKSSAAKEEFKIKSLSRKEKLELIKEYDRQNIYC